MAADATATEAKSEPIPEAGNTQAPAFHKVPNPLITDSPTAQDASKGDPIEPFVAPAMSPTSLTHAPSPSTPREKAPVNTSCLVASPAPAKPSDGDVLPNALPASPVMQKNAAQI
jgi:hypothetical protein